MQNTKVEKLQEKNTLPAIEIYLRFRNNHSEYWLERESHSPHLSTGVIIRRQVLFILAAVKLNAAQFKKSDQKRN